MTTTTGCEHGVPWTGECHDCPCENGDVRGEAPGTGEWSQHCTLWGGHYGECVLSEAE
jgi:hypothetical protein